MQGASLLQAHGRRYRYNKRLCASRWTRVRQVADDKRTFTVKLASSGQSIEIPEEGTILFTLLEHGVEVPFSCGHGICGACETGVVSGEPDHRDFILSDDEKAENKTIMICCSRSFSDELELDL